MTRIRSNHPTHPGRSVRRGFSFTEVLFAVMILGIGFIMIAGIFPVALSQTQAASDDTVGAGVASGAIEYLAKLPQSNTYMQVAGQTKLISPYATLYAPAPPPTPSPDTNSRELGLRMSGNQILPEDTRYAWVPFYRRTLDWTGQNSNTAQVTVVVCRAREKASYNFADLGPGMSLDPVRIWFDYNLSVGDAAPDRISNVVTNGSTDALVEGAFLVIEGDPSGISTGFVLRLGNPTNAARTEWELLPGNDLKSLPISSKPTKASAFVIGRARDAGGNYTGASQSIAAYTTYVPVN